MTDSPEIMPIEYGVYAASDADAMAKLLGEVFSRRDPPAVAARADRFRVRGVRPTVLPKSGGRGPDHRGPAFRHGGTGGRAADGG